MVTDPSLIDQLKEQATLCGQLVEKSDFGRAFNVCTNMLSQIVRQNNTNVYDIRERCEMPPLCYNFTSLDRLMRQEDVQQALGVHKRPWKECDSKVKQFLARDLILDCKPFVSSLLDNGINVLVYSGKEDFICNYYGGRDWTEHMQWTGQDAFNQADRESWTINGQVAGQVKQSGALTVLEIEGAGHMVPKDQPEAALAMFGAFLNGDQFQSRDEPVRVAYA